jgi:hypothetical protein
MRPWLLILDTSEHLLTATDLVVEPARSLPSLKLLITSREPLWEMMDVITCQCNPSVIRLASYIRSSGQSEGRHHMR